MTQDDLAGQLRSDVSALQYYDSLGLDLPSGFLDPSGPRLVQPSLVVLGYGEGVWPRAATRVIHRLAQLGLRQRRRVVVTSGRDWTQELRAACLVGVHATGRLAHERPRPDDPELDAKTYLGDLAEPGRHLTVHAVAELSRGVTFRGVVDTWLIDDIASVEPMMRESLTDGQRAAFDPSPVGLRRASRLWMRTVVVTVDWRYTDRWPWVREADVIVEIEPDDEGLPVIRDGDQVERLPV